MTNQTSNEDEEKEEGVVETSLFEDLERITNEHEKEDLNVLDNDNEGEIRYYETQSEEEDEETTPEQDAVINKTQKLFIDDGKLDYNIKSPLVFKIGSISKKFLLKEEELDRYAGIYEEMYRSQFSLAVYHKSLQDQIRQKGSLVDSNKLTSIGESMLDKLWEIKLLKFFCDELQIDEKTKDQLVEKEIDRLFSKPVINVNKSNNDNEANKGVNAILKKLKKAGL